MDVIESIFWTGFTMACTVIIVVTCVYATMFMGSKLTQYLYDVFGDPQKQSDAEVEVAMGIVALVFAFSRLIFTIVTLKEGQLTLWIFNGAVARSCAEICVALGLLTLAVAALHVLLR
jgi:hypothetical protein